MRASPEPTPGGGEAGVVLAASGRRFVTLAEQTAASLRATNPGLAVDIFCDASPARNDLFDQVHTLDRSWFRPKFEAILRSRFVRTLYLDADLVVVADIGDIFALLDRFDVAGAHVQNRNQAFAKAPWRRPLPAAFPQINGGVLAVRQNQKTRDLFETCQRVLIEEELEQDQPVIRELLWDSDLRLAVLPPEYNVRRKALLNAANSRNAAPRILHHSDFVWRMRDEKTAPSAERIYGAAVMRHVRDLVAADGTLPGGPRRDLDVPTMNEPRKYLAYRLRRALAR